MMIRPKNQANPCSFASTASVPSTTSITSIPSVTINKKYNKNKFILEFFPGIQPGRTLENAEKTPFYSCNNEFIICRDKKCYFFNEDEDDDDDEPKPEPIFPFPPPIIEQGAIKC